MGLLEFFARKGTTVPFLIFYVLRTVHVLWTIEASLTVAFRSH